MVKTLISEKKIKKFEKNIEFILWPNRPLCPRVKGPLIKVASYSGFEHRSDLLLRMKRTCRSTTTLMGKEKIMCLIIIKY